jgi:hypothetical protein
MNTLNWLSKEPGPLHPRASNRGNKTPEQYARDLLYDGLHKGWLQS